MDQQALITLLRRTFKGGLRRVPKKQKEAQALLALSLIGLDPEGIFDELEIDNHIQAWIAALSPHDFQIDHVTWRRALVDYGFLRRATDGAIYRIRGETIAASLSAEAQQVDPTTVFTEVENTRNHRREQAAKT